MKLKPLDFETPVQSIRDQYQAAFPPRSVPEKEVKVPEGAIDEILNVSGVIETISSDDPNSKLRGFLNQKGGNLEDVATQIVNIMCRGETEASRLRAAEFIAKIQGVQAEVDEKPQAKDVTINIFGSESKNLIAFVMPRT